MTARNAPIDVVPPATASPQPTDERRPAAGTDRGQRRLNGRQRSGRDYRDLSEPVFFIDRTSSMDVPTRDGTVLKADVFLPSTRGPRSVASVDGGLADWDPTLTAPALVSFSCYPRQVQDLGAPLGFIEAGASDFFVPRGYAHVIVNARGTSGSEGTFTLGDQQEQHDVYDVVEWVGEQPWCDGQVGGIGISYFANAQLAAAAQRPPHLKAIFPFATLDDLYAAVWHGGVLSSGFFSPWMSAVGILSAVSDDTWRSHRVDVARRILNSAPVHGRMAHVNGAAAVTVLRDVMRTHYAEEPFGRLWQEAAVEHPTHDEWWDQRDIRAQLARIEVPVYLGCQWDNIPMHLPSTFPVFEGLAHNPNVRMTLVDRGGLAWPWESMHEEALAWYDHWLKGKDTGIMDGPPIRYVIPGTDEWRTADEWPPKESRHVAYALRADGVLSTEEGVPGTRPYLYLPADSGRPRNANAPTLADRLTWTTAPVVEPVDVVGDIELVLDASISALDTAWMVVLSDISPDGTATSLSAGWLRAQLRTVDDRASRPGRPVLPCREPLAVPVGEVVRYRVPIVPNARRIAPGHRLELVVTSADEGEDGPTVLGFTHTPVSQSSVNTVHSSSRLLLPVISAQPGLQRLQ